MTIRKEIKLKMGNSHSLKEAAMVGDVDYLDELINNGKLVHQTLDARILTTAYINGHDVFVWKLLENALIRVDNVELKSLPLDNNKHLTCFAYVLWFKVYKLSLKQNGSRFKEVIRACYNQNFEVNDDILIKISAIPCKENEKIQIYSTLLFLLTFYNTGCPEPCIKKLIEVGADWRCTFFGYNACEFCLLCDNAHILQLLITTHSKNKSEIVDLKRDWLKFSIIHERNDCIEVLLQDESIDINFNNPEKFMVDYFLRVANRGQILKLELLISRGINVNMKNESGVTALMYAAIGHSASVIDILLECNANVNAVDNFGQTALMHAVQRGAVESVARLLCSGADISIIDEGNETALSLSTSSKVCMEIIMESRQFEESSVILNHQHRETFFIVQRQLDAEKLNLLLKHGVFSWNWLADIKIPTPLLTYVFISCSITPGHFYAKRSNVQSTSTLFQSALEMEDINTAYFLLANLYLDEYDYKYLRYNRECIDRLCKTENKDVVKLLQLLTCSVFDLQTICLLSLSSAFKKVELRKFSRKERVESLLLPAKFKTVLNFEGTYSKLCVNHWHHLAKAISQSLDVTDTYDFLFGLRQACLPSEIMECSNGCGSDARGFRYLMKILSNRSSRSAI